MNVIRRTVRASACALLLATAQCLSATASGPALVAMRGTWNYRADQMTPSAMLLGTMTINRQTGNQFTGTWAVEETSAGSPRELSGVVTGQAIDSTHVDFDVQTGTEVRHHLARVGNDSLNGTWFGVEGDAPTGGSGAFNANRVP